MPGSAAIWASGYIGCHPAHRTALPAALPPEKAAQLRGVQYETRSFRLDLSRCPACGGPMRLIAVLTDPAPIRTYLDGVGLDSRPPPITPPCLHPQPEFEYAA